jgi:hypothetical protein
VDPATVQVMEYFEKGAVLLAFEQSMVFLA